MLPNLEDPEENLDYAERLLEGDLTVEETVDGMDARAAFVAFRGGKTEPDISPESEVFAVERSGPEKLVEYLDEMTSEKSLAGKAWDYGLMPAKLALLELPRRAGRKSSAVDGVISPIVGEKTALGLSYNTGRFAQVWGGIGLGSSVVGSYVLPGEMVIEGAASAGAIMTGSFLRGRAESYAENGIQEYLDEIEEEAGDYRIETF